MRLVDVAVAKTVAAPAWSRWMIQTATVDASGYIRSVPPRHE